MEQYLFKYELPDDFKISHCINKENLKMNMMSLSDFINVTPFDKDVEYINSILPKHKSNNPVYLKW